MKIKKEKSSILFQSRDVKVSLALDQSLDLGKSDSDIVVSKYILEKKETENTFIVETPGEYESNDVFIQAVSSPGDAGIQIISLDIEGINTVYAESISVLPPKRSIEQLGINNILIYKFDDKFENLKELIDALDPNYLLLITNNEDAVKTLAGKFSLIVPEQLSLLNVNSSDFDDINEDRPMELILLK